MSTHKTLGFLFLLTAGFLSAPKLQACDLNKIYLTGSVLFAIASENGSETTITTDQAFATMKADEKFAGLPTLSDECGSGTYPLDQGTVDSRFITDPLTHQGLGGIKRAPPAQDASSHKNLN